MYQISSYFNSFNGVFVLYSTPIKLGLSFHRVINPPIDSQEVLRYPTNFVDDDLNPQE